MKISRTPTIIPTFWTAEKQEGQWKSAFSLYNTALLLVAHGLNLNQMTRSMLTCLNKTKDKMVSGVTGKELLSLTTQLSNISSTWLCRHTETFWYVNISYYFTTLLIAFKAIVKILSLFIFDFYLVSLVRSSMKVLNQFDE